MVFPLNYSLERNVSLGSKVEYLNCFEGKKKVLPLLVKNTCFSMSANSSQLQNMILQKYGNQSCTLSSDKAQTDFK